MTIREKSLLITGLTIVLLVAVSQSITEMFLTEHFSDLSIQLAWQDVHRFRNTLDAELDAMNAFNSDWAGWDPTYAFIEDGNTNYINANLVDSAFTALSLNLIVFLRADGRIVWGSGFDLQARATVPLSSNTLSLLQNAKSPLTCTNDTMIVKGLIRMDEQPTMISCCPILTSDDKGPLRGTLIMGRHLDDAVIARLAKINSLRISAVTSNQEAMVAGDFRACQIPDDPDSIHRRCTDRGPCSTRTLLRDVQDKPCTTLILEHKDCMQQARRLVAVRFTVALLIAGLVVGFAGFVALERLVLRRLFRLSAQAKTMGMNADATTRLPREGRDEISILASEINRLLDRLAQSQEELRLFNVQLEKRVEERTRALREESVHRGQSESRYSALVESERDVISRWLPDTTFTFVNSALGQFLGQSPAELVGRKWLDLSPLSRRAESQTFVQNLLADPRVWTTEVELESSARQVRCIQWVSSPIFDSAYNVLEFQSVGHDVTEERKITQDLERSRAEIQRLYRHLDQLRETEQRLLAERLHDEVGQAATVLKMDAEWAVKQIAIPTEEQRKRLAEMTNSIDLLTKMIQEIAMDLRPSMLDHFGLPVALQWVAGKFGERSGVHCNLEVDESLSPDPTVSIMLFRIFQELLTNIARHSGANRITIRLQSDGPLLCLEVEDDGRGIRKEEIQSPTSFGLTAIRERATGLGGKICIQGKPGVGTKITVCVPLNQESRTSS